MDPEYDRIWRAMYDHRLEPDTADQCACGTATYSTPGYYHHVYEVARAIERHPGVEKITERHLKGH